MSTKGKNNTPSELSDIKSKMAAMSKKYGEGSIQSGNDILDIERVSTGSLSLDIITGGGWGVGKIIEVYGPESSGKALSLDSKILTPTGWIYNKDIQVGTVVCTPDGGTSTVIGVYPQGVKPLYKFTLDDKSSVEACGEHLWFIGTRDSKLGDIMSTGELLSSGVQDKYGKNKFKIPMTSPIHLENGCKNLPIDPYILGLFLGDGGFTGTNISYTTGDFILIDVIQEYFDKKYGNVLIKKKPSDTREYNFTITKKDSGNDKDAFRKDIIELGLSGIGSHDKFIPNVYKFASVQDRIALIQGLMDSDGSTDTFGASYTTVSKQLSDDFIFIAKSLGIRCTTSSRVTKYKSSEGVELDGKRSYRSNILRTSLDFDLFRLEKHLAKRKNGCSTHAHRFIESIEPIGEKECQCIAIGHPDKLYITDDFIVTHNTTLAIHSMVESQKKFPNKAVGVIDAEHALDRKYCKRLGLDMDRVFICQPDNGEQGIDIAIDMAKSGDFSFILVDSIAALTPKSEMEGESGDSSMGVHARLMGKFMRMAAGVCSTTKTTLYLSNQLRSKLGVVYGNPETQPGGNAVKFYASTRVDIRKVIGDKDGDDVKNIKSTCKTVKNKLAPPFRKCEFYINFGTGIDKASEILIVGEQTGLIKRAGAWFSYQDAKLGQGAENAKNTLRDNPEIMDAIEAIIRANISTYDDMDIEEQAI